MAFPERETWFAWKEFSKVDGESTPRLLIPWGDPMEYEHPADGIFDTEEEARTWKDENAPEEEWVLCRVTYEPITRWTECPGCGQVKEYDANVWRNYSNKPGSGVRYVCGDCAPKEDNDVGEQQDASRD